MKRRFWVLAAVAAALLVAAPSAPADVTPLVGSLHEHSGYSDGWPGSRPQTYYESGKSSGSTSWAGPSTPTTPTCRSSRASTASTRSSRRSCALADPVNPLDSFRKWDATLEQARAATTPTFTAFRGFEWTSDRFGHINVYFSQQRRERQGRRRLRDDGHVLLLVHARRLARRRLRRPRDLQPSRRQVALDDSDPGFNWNDFAYVPQADARMVGIEVFNDHEGLRRLLRARARQGLAPGRGRRRGPRPPLHRRLGRPGLGEDRDPRREPLRGRAEGGDARAPLLRDPPPGHQPHLHRRRPARWARASRRTEGKPIKVARDDQRPDREARARHERRPGGRDRPRHASPPSPKASAADRYYFVRALDAAGQPDRLLEPGVGRRALPRSGPDTASGSRATCTCTPASRTTPTAAPDDDNTGPDEFYTLGLNVGQRFLEASARGLDYLAITDHNDVRSSADPDFGSHGVIGIPAYENSLHGHAQMLGATRALRQRRQLRRGRERDGDALRADGGVFQINHPAGNIEAAVRLLRRHRRARLGATATTCARHDRGLEPDQLDPVRRDLLGVLARPRRPHRRDRRQRLALALDRGRPGRRQPDDVGVRARPQPRTAILEAIRAGRTTISRIPPAPGRRAAPARGRRATATAASSRSWATRCRRARRCACARPACPAAGLVKVRANGATLVDEVPLGPGGELRFRAPDAGRLGARRPAARPERQPGRARAASPTASSSRPARPTISWRGSRSPIYLGR